MYASLFIPDEAPMPKIRNGVGFAPRTVVTIDRLDLSMPNAHAYALYAALHQRFGVSIYDSMPEGATAADAIGLNSKGEDA